MDLVVLVTQITTKELQTRWCNFAQNGSLSNNFVYPINFDFKMVLEWLEHSVMVKIQKILLRITLCANDAALLKMSILSNFFNPINFDLKFHFKMVLE